MHLTSKLEKSFAKKSDVKIYLKISGVKASRCIRMVKVLNTKVIRMIKLEHLGLDNGENAERD